MLGGGVRSLLFRTLREEQKLCYLVQSYASSNALGGYLGIHVNCERSKLNQAYQALVDVFAQLQEQGFSTHELERARRARRTQILSVLANTSKHTQAIGRRAVLGADFFVDTENIFLNAVRLDDVQAVIHQVLDLKKAAFVGHGVDEERLLALL